MVGVSEGNIEAVKKYYPQGKKNACGRFFKREYVRKDQKKIARSMNGRSFEVAN